MDYMKLKLNCVRCRFNTTDLTVMKNHADLAHDNDDVEMIKFEQEFEHVPCSVQKCPFVARSNGEVNEHEKKAHHLKRSKINCEFCSSRVRSLIELAKHQLEIHFTSRIYGCVACEYQSNRYSYKKYSEKIYKYF